MKALDTGKTALLPAAALPEDVVARAALAACHAQSRVARETLGRGGPLCHVPCAGCLAAARAVAVVPSGWRTSARPLGSVAGRHVCRR